MVGGSVRSLTFTNLRPDTSYRLSVQPIGPAGTGPWTTVNAYVLSVPQAPGEPRDFWAVRDDVSYQAPNISLNWVPLLSDGQSPVTGYRVSRDGTDTDGTGAYTTVLPASARTFTLRYLDSHWPCTVRVQAISAAGTGEVAAATVTLEMTTAGPPTGITAVKANGQATVGWVAPVNTGSSAITGYRVRRFSGATMTWLSSTTVAATAHSYTATGLTNGTPYSFDVTTINASGLSGVSLRSPVVIPATLPGAPVIGLASSGIAGGTINATAHWAAPASNGGTAISGYRVYAHRMSSTGAVLATTISAIQGPTLRALTPTLPVTGSYRFAVRAINAIGYSGCSARSNLVTGR